MAAVWADLSTRKLQGKLHKNEEKFFKKLVKVLGYLGVKCATFKDEMEGRKWSLQLRSARHDNEGHTA